MKKLLLPLLLVTAFACQPAHENKQAVSSARQESPILESYGEEIDPEGAVKAENLVAFARSRDSLTQLKVKAEVIGSCPVKGCWMKVKLEDGQEMRVTFKDYGFFVPKDLKGEEVIFKGILNRSITDVKTLQHFAEDEGASEEEIQQITQPEEGFAFEASGVLLKAKEN